MNNKILKEKIQELYPNENFRIGDKVIFDHHFHKIFDDSNLRIVDFVIQINNQNKKDIFILLNEFQTTDGSLISSNFFRTYHPSLLINITEKRRKKIKRIFND